MKGIIYCIECNDTGDKYIGSTTEKVNERMRHHRDQVRRYDKGIQNYCSSYPIIKNGNYKYYELEELEVETRRELAIRERHFVENNKCINMRIPSRSIKESKKEYSKKVIECSCGKNYTQSHKLRHFSSQYHKDNYIANLKS